MSSDEYLTNDEESSAEEGIETSDNDSGSEDDSRTAAPSRELTIEDSDADSASDPDESIVVKRNRGVGKKKKRAVIESDSELEEEEEELERRAFSPRTRMSITGIRPADLTDDSSEIEYSDADDRTSNNKLSNISEVYQEDALTDDDDNQADVSKPRRSMLDQTEEEEASDIQSSTMGHSESDGNRSEMASNVSASMDNNSEIAESSSEKNSSTSSPKVSSTKGRDDNINSPSLPARYSTNFEKGIQDKLSSTLYQPREVVPEIDSSVDSDIQIIERVEKPIVVSSEDDDDEEKENLTSSNTSGSMSKTAQKSGGNLLQPKISSALSNLQPTTKSNAHKTPINKANLRHVSQDYFDKEIKKFEELKSELTNAEKLLEKISKSLPDGGKQLSLRIERLRSDLTIKSRFIASLHIEDAPGASGPIYPPEDKDSPSQKMQEIQKHRKAFFTNSEAPNWDDLSAAVNQIQPTYTGKQGMATFNNQKVLTVERLKVRRCNIARVRFILF